MLQGHMTILLQRPQVVSGDPVTEFSPSKTVLVEIVVAVNIFFKIDHVLHVSVPLVRFRLIRFLSRPGLIFRHSKYCMSGRSGWSMPFRASPRSLRVSCRSLA